MTFFFELTVILGREKTWRTKKWLPFYLAPGPPFCQAITDDDCDYCFPRKLRLETPVFFKKRSFWGF